MKKNAYKFAYIGIAALLSIIMYFISSAKFIATPNIQLNNISLGNTNLSNENSVTIHKDSFQVIAKKAYRDLISFKHNNPLEINLSNTNKLASDFYNNNRSLLNLSLEKDNISITHEESTGSVKALFHVINDYYITVPADVISQIMYKNYNK